MAPQDFHILPQRKKGSREHYNYILNSQGMAAGVIFKPHLNCISAIVLNINKALLNLFHFNCILIIVEVWKYF